MLDRRNLLKLFGAGATIVPLIGGEPEVTAPVKLIEEAKFEPVVLKPSMGLPNLTNIKYHITVDVVTENQEHFRFSADAFTIDVKIKTGGINSMFPLAAAGKHEIEWMLKGGCIPTSSGIIATFET